MSNQGHGKLGAVMVMVAETGAAIGANLTQPQIQVLANELVEKRTINLPDIRAGLDRCKAELINNLPLREILKRIPGEPPSPEEAFSMVVKSRFWEEWGSTDGMLKAAVASFNAENYQKNPRGEWFSFKTAYEKNLTKYGNSTLGNVILIENKTGQKQPSEYGDDLYPDPEGDIQFVQDELKDIDRNSFLGARRAKELDRVIEHRKRVIARRDGQPYAPPPDPIIVGEQVRLTPEETIGRIKEQSQGIERPDSNTGKNLVSLALTIIRKQCGKISERDRRDYAEVIAEHLPLHIKGKQYG